MFINRRIYTDVLSYKVLFHDEKKGMAIQVEKKPKNLNIIPYSFCGFSPNQREAFDNSEEIHEVGNPFEIVYYKGVWGYWKTEGFIFHGVSEKNSIRQKNHSESLGQICKITEDENGTYDVQIIFTTKGGKPKKSFIKLGQIEKECKYFYDYNF